MWVPILSHNLLVNSGNNNVTQFYFLDFWTSFRNIYQKFIRYVMAYFTFELITLRTNIDYSTITQFASC